MKFISWNVNGLRACVGKDFKESFAKLDADFFCLQETKMQEGQLDISFDGYESYWNYAEKKGYSGTAIFTRHHPLSVSKGIGIEEHDKEGRVITLEYPDFYLVTVYTPNSQDQLRRLDYRMHWEDDFQAYLHQGGHAGGGVYQQIPGAYLLGGILPFYQGADLCLCSNNDFHWYHILFWFLMINNT